MLAPHRRRLLPLIAPMLAAIFPIGCRSQSQQTEPLVSRLDASAATRSDQQRETDTESAEALLSELSRLPPCSEEVPDVMSFEPGTLKGFAFPSGAVVCDGMSTVLYVDPQSELVWMINSGGVGGRVNIPQGPWRADEPIVRRLLIALRGHDSERHWEQMKDR